MDSSFVLVCWGIRAERRILITCPAGCKRLAALFKNGFS
jgi:hypothetical protein